MDARICTNPACRTIQPGHRCGLCNTATRSLPQVSLSLIGVEGAARLTHTPGHAYSIILDTPSGPHAVDILMSDLLQASQAHLPLVNEASGLAIMDGLRNAAALVRTKNTGHWAGWIRYFLDLLQGHTDRASFQEVLRDIQQAVDAAILEDLDPPEAP